MDLFQLDVPRLVHCSEQFYVIYLPIQLKLELKVPKKKTVAWPDSFFKLLKIAVILFLPMMPPASEGRTHDLRLT